MSTPKKPTVEELRVKIAEDLDFIASTRYNNSLKAILRRFPDGLDNKTIAKLLLLENPDEVETLYKDSVEKLKDLMDVDTNDESECS